MGTLLIRRIPAFFNQNKADHTYVECGTGRRAWSCWGRKAGGRALTVGSGSTVRADTIAEPNERGGITCYAINGVCHQAANRIAFPAGILCIGARGYGLSETIFGPYGRPNGPLGRCQAPFNQHPGITGDLQECFEPQDVNRVQQPSTLAASPTSAESQERTELGVRLFMNKAQFNLGPSAPQAILEGEFRDFDKARLEIENAFLNRHLSASLFSIRLNDETVEFQQRLADRLNASQYERLFDLKPGEWTVLTDPDLAEQVYKP